MSDEVNTFENVKESLQKQTQIGSVKVDLFSHTTEIINRILSHHKYDAYQKFEEISLLIKKTQLNVPNPKTSDQLKYISENEAQEELNKYIACVRSLINEKLELPSVDRAFIAKSPECAIGDFMENMKLLEWAGISLGKTETYGIYKSILRLAKVCGAKSLRFWGKILAKGSDYYIVEGEPSEIENNDVPFGQEPRGKGVNKYVYWVTTSILDDWIELPDANPEYIKFSRQFKRILSGDLNSDVNSNPPFPGKERHLLRAQIARIAHATTLHPKGLLEVDEEKEDQLNYAEEFTLPGLADLNSNEVWGHQYPNILKAGRITHQRPNVPDEEADEIMAKLEEEDKVMEKLMGINEDEPIKPLETAWLLKIVGDDQPYNPDGEEEGTMVYAANVIKSLRWPGAFTVAYDGKWTNLYIGYGLKYGDVSYNPTAPDDIMQDPIEAPEMPEPTPLEAPEEPLEPDTDEENKPQGEGDDN